MTQKEIMDAVVSILETVRAAVLTAVDRDGRPRSRWMVPAVLPGYDGAIHTVVAPRFRTTLDLHRHPDAEWMVQTLSLNQVVNLRGRLTIIDNPSLKAQLLEAIGARLHAFWKLANEETDFVILETTIAEATYYFPMKGRKETVVFRQGEGR